jgi:hypothetical protein
VREQLLDQHRDAGSGGKEQSVHHLAKVLVVTAYSIDVSAASTLF